MNILGFLYLALSIIVITQWGFFGTYLVVRDPAKKLSQQSWFCRVSPHAFLTLSVISMVLIAILSVVNPNLHWIMIACTFVLIVISALLLQKMYQKELKRPINKKTKNSIVNLFVLIFIILYALTFIQLSFTSDGGL